MSVIAECKEYEECLDALDELKEHAVVLTQDKGSSLQLDGGTVADEELQETLSAGIDLPQIPDKNIYLTEGVEKECLAFSICYDCVQNNLGKGRLVVEPIDVLEYYKNREIPLQRIATALRFLDEIGACRKIEDTRYEFTTNHLRNIMNVEEKLNTKRVDEWLDEENDDQSNLSAFTEDDIGD